jgi:hypothetical protein
VAHRLGAAALAVALVGLAIVFIGINHGPSRLDAQPAGFVNADRPGINAHNSPAVAADPRNPAVVALADRIDTPRFSCSVSLSTSAGVTWKPLTPPLPPDAPNCYWPDVAFDGDGRLLVLFTATGGRYNQPVGVWLERFDRSGDGATATGTAVKVAGPEAFHAHFTADGNGVWVAWVQTPPANADRPLGFEPGSNPLMLARSTDGGLTFSPPIEVSEPGRRVAQPRIVVTGAGGGDVLVGALDYGDDVFDYEAQHGGQGGPPPPAHWRIVSWRSTDGGATFPPGATVVADSLPVPQRVVIDLAPGPSFAADPASGRVYAAWDAGVGSARDVFVAASTNGGASWTQPRRVGPTKEGQLLPAVGVAAGGRVDVVFYDRSRDPNDVLADAAVASSWDGGKTWTTARASDERFDTRIGTGSVQGLPQLGNQLAVLSRPDGFLAFWSDTSRGTISSNVQDLGFASVTPHGRTRAWSLVALGIVVVLAGFGLAMVSRIRRRQPASGRPLP